MSCTEQSKATVKTKVLLTFKMSANTKVLNETNGCRIKRSQAKRRVEQCVSAWVIENYSIRDLNLQERVIARSAQAKLQEPLSYAEVPGLRYEPSVGGTVAHRQGFSLIKQAHEFCNDSY